MTEKEFSEKISSFCLFRIPNQGARVIWEVTNQCNYNCPYCIFSSGTHKNHGELTTSRALSLISELKEHGFTHLKITGGEPFMRPDMIELLAQAAKAGLKTDVSTNASLITEEKANALAALKLDMIHISLDGHIKEIQEKARGKDTFEKTIRGIKNLVNAQAGYIRIGCLIFKENENYLKEIALFCKELGVNEVIFSLMEPIGRGSQIKNLITDKPVSFFKKIINEIKIDNLKVNYSFSEKAVDCSGCRCPGGEKFLFINNVGTVSPCPWISGRAPEYIYPRSLVKNSLPDVLKDKRYIELTKDLQSCGLEYCPAQQPEILHEIQNLKLAFSKKAALGKRFNQNTAAYLFTTENIAESLNSFNFNNKKVLMIGSSGDHIFNAVLKGAKEIDCFDINIYSRYIIELKFQAVRMLSFEEFKKFFFEESFNLNLYTLVRPSLSIPARYFFDKLVKDKKFKTKVLKDMYIPQSRILSNNLYLSAQGYAELKSKIEDVKYCFINSDVCELASKTDKRYDFISLSNISDYAHLMFEGDYLAAFNDKVIKPLFSRLEAKGTIALGYVYDLLDKHKSSLRSKINVSSARKAAFGNNSGFSYYEESFSSAIEEDNQDGILVLERI